MSVVKEKSGVDAVDFLACKKMALELIRVDLSLNIVTYPSLLSFSLNNKMLNILHYTYLPYLNDYKHRRNLLNVL